MRHLFPAYWSIEYITHHDQLRALSLETLDAVILDESCWHDYPYMYDVLAQLRAKPGLKIYLQTRNWVGWLMAPLAHRYTYTDLTQIAISAGCLVGRTLCTTRRQADTTGTFIERLIASLPFVRTVCPYRLITLAHTSTPLVPLSVSIIVPCKNESGNIDQAVREIPEFPGGSQIVFVIGSSHDGSLARAHETITRYKDRSIMVIDQTSRGKKSGVLEGIRAAHGDIIMIYDGDITLAGSQLSAVYDQFTTGRAEFVNGSRLVYPLPAGAMPWMNQWVNRSFARIFSWLLGVRLTDTLCGTKAWRAHDTTRILSIQQVYGNSDPFGDFDFICGAVYQQLIIREIALAYRPRTYGVTQIAYWRDGWILLCLGCLIWINYGMGYKRTPEHRTD